MYHLASAMDAGQAHVDRSASLLGVDLAAGGVLATGALVCRRTAAVRPVAAGVVDLGDLDGRRASRPDAALVTCDDCLPARRRERPLRPADVEHFRVRPKDDAGDDAVCRDRLEHLTRDGT